jgi:antitoxin ParD1/3/4
MGGHIGCAGSSQSLRNSGGKVRWKAPVLAGKCFRPVTRKQNNMAITIPEELQAFVSRSVASGRFRSEDEAVQKGRKLLRDREDKLEALRADLQVGIDQVDSGQKVPFDVAAIEQRGQELLAGR